MARFSESFIDDLRDRLPISEVIGTRVTWDPKKTRANRGDWWGCCPFHGESRPSFHCEDSKGRYHCFGCGVSGDHFRFLMEMDGVTFPRAIEMVADLAGVSLPDARPETDAERRNRLKREADRKRHDEERARQEERRRERKVSTVRQVWSESKPIAGTLADTYLQSRLLERQEWPASLRFHPHLRYTLDDSRDPNARYFPALVCGVQAADRALIAIWQIFLDPDTGRKAAVDVDKGESAKLGFGPAGGGAVRLGPVTETLKLTEGVETGLAVRSMGAKQASVWATLSTSGMIGFQIPAGVKRLEIYADGDRHRAHKLTGAMVEPPGILAAKKLQERAIAEGIDAAIFPSPEPDDWLDVYQARKRDEQRQRAVQYRA